MIQISISSVDYFPKCYNFYVHNHDDDGCQAYHVYKTEILDVMDSDYVDYLDSILTLKKILCQKLKIK